MSTSFGYLRRATILVASVTIAAPVALVLWQSFLTEAFFSADAKPSLSAYVFVFSDPDFWRALETTIALAAGMVLIAVPLGAIFAFLYARTDVPGRRWAEPMIVIPIFLSPLVLAFGYIVALGPVGFLTVWWQEWFGAPFWDIYSFTSLVLISGLTHAPHVYLYASAAARSLPGDLEEAGRTNGASALRVAFDISLPMIRPSLIYSGILIFFLGFEMFGLPLVLGDPQGRLVLSTYLYKLTNKLGVPSYQLMAVVVVVILMVGLPLVTLQQKLLSDTQRYASIRGKASATTPIRLGALRWPAFAVVIVWFLFTVVIPMAGLFLRSVVSSWGIGIDLSQVLTLDNYRETLGDDEVRKAIYNTLLVAIIGGGLSIAVYSLIAVSQHRWRSRWSVVLDYVVMLPRALPGLVAGLAIFWIFLFVKPIAPLRTTLFSIWLAYTLVWFAYGLRVIQSSLMQISPELEEGARVAGATEGRSVRDVTLPLIRHGLISAWLLIFLIFSREYSTAVYLLSPDTEVIGSLIVSQWGSGAVELVTTLACVNVAIIFVGLIAANRLGVKLNG
jgi:iron(III) transport system permease protein